MMFRVRKMEIMEKKNWTKEKRRIFYKMEKKSVCFIYSLLKFSFIKEI